MASKRGLNMKKLIGEAVKNAKDRFNNKADYFNLITAAGMRPNCHCRIGKRIIVDFLINEKLVFEITERRIKQRAEFCELKGFKYVCIPRWIADACPGAVIKDIQRILKQREN